MSDIALIIAILATAVWTGTIVFHSFVVAPTVFRSLDEAAARSFLRTLFPRFYKLGLICGLLMLGSLAAAATVGGWPPALSWLAGAALVMTLAEALSLWLTPKINAARDAGEAGQRRFERLHRLSVLLTIGILILAIGVLAVLPGAVSAAS